MSRELSDHEREIRDEVVKSTVTGVSLTALAVVAFSSAGFGGLIGTSQASGANPLPAPDADPYVSLPAYPQPMTADEIDSIRAQLASTSASIEITIAATESSIERVRSLAVAGGLSETPVGPTSNLNQAMRLVAAADDLRPRIAADAPDIASAEGPPQGLSMADARYAGGGAETDSHLEFAALLLREEFEY